ncbi:hypothetical protein OSB04_016596 [Centaurea solstitialis]|uniref:Retrovirus-related Pol polyprotein from transposon TNT 1-94-like beta-barrel domain-containing protein n=1 Tax=Centaurea solstitialis TaxID=347529 RepID=A0AA38TCB3_9ASTR|nr:hypothetical protein OSB04_016596 [Centaurea solstitialis]
MANPPKDTYVESGSLAKPPRFNADNFPLWKSRMELFLSGSDPQIPYFLEHIKCISNANGDRTHIKVKVSKNKMEGFEWQVSLQRFKLTLRSLKGFQEEDFELLDETTEVPNEETLVEVVPEETHIKPTLLTLQTNSLVWLRLFWSQIGSIPVLPNTFATLNTCLLPIKASTTKNQCTWGTPLPQRSKGRGKVILNLTLGKELVLTDVLHVPAITKNLLSNPTLSIKGFKMVFEYDKVVGHMLGRATLMRGSSSLALYQTMLM